MLAALAKAEGPPQPKIGATCPPGSGYCMPNANTKCRAMPKLGATCPVGYTASGGTQSIETVRAGETVQQKTLVRP
jgi:hypothetical protein